jgi:hypothetical protein
MNLDYKTTTSGNSLRTIHVIVIDGEFLSTTRSTEILQFAKNRNPSRYNWKQIKNAVRLGEQLRITNGQLV